MIYINVVNQRLSIASTCDEFVSGSQKFVKFKFNLGDDWDALSPFAQFQQNGRAYNQYLDSDNCVFLPSEIVAGTCTLMLYGSGDTVIATTNYLTFRISDNNFISDAQSTDISQSLYDQLIDLVNEVTSLTRGEPGEDGFSPTVTVERTDSGTLVGITDKDGTNSFTVPDGKKGDTGVGIVRIEHFKTEGLIKTYRIYLSNGQTYDFTVNDGARGEPGEKGMGILSVSLLKTEGKEKTYRIFMSDSTSTKTYDYVVTDGADGEPGETGVSVTGATVTDSGHLNITLSDGTEIDAGEISQLVKSVNGKTGDVTLSASDVGAPSDEEFNLTSQVLSLTGNDMVKIDDMFGTDYISAFLGFYAKDAVYVMLTSSSSLASGQTLTATPVWSSAPYSAGGVDGIQLGKWYKLGHPTVGSYLPLTAVQIKTSSGMLMSPSNYLHVRYATNTSGFELIQTITTTDSDNSFTVTPSTPLSKAYVSIEIPENTTSPTIFYQVYNGSAVLGYVGGTVSSKNYTSCLEFGTDRNENIVESWVKYNVAIVASGGQTSKYYNPRVITTLPIEHIVLRLSGTNKFPNGLKINVYGVKV